MPYTAKLEKNPAAVERFMKSLLEAQNYIKDNSEESKKIVKDRFDYESDYMDLGLASVYGIVKQSGEFIWVYSELGEGTTFKTYLPKVVEDVESVRDKGVSGKKLDGSKTVLIVEDNDMVLDLARKALKRHRYRVLEAQNGEKALKVIEQYKGTIHLLVTDAWRSLKRKVLNLNSGNHSKDPSRKRP